MAWLRSSALGFLLILGFTLAAIGCGPGLKRVAVPQEKVKAEREKQQEIAFKSFIEKEDRLLKVSFPLLVAAASLWKGKALPGYGFILHDKNMYKDEYRWMAIRYYGIGEQIAVRYVHPDLPAAASGLQVGDRILAINGQDLAGQDTTRALKILDEFEKSDEPLHLCVGREGQTLDLDIPKVPVCKYSVGLTSSDAVNAFADGFHVIITTGMMRFAEKDEELALVVGHEIAHNALEHVTQNTVNYYLAQAFEAEADYAGLYLAALAGYDISGAANFWRRMAAEHPESIRKTFMSTHPSTPERFVAIEETVSEVAEKKRQGKPLLPEKK